MASARWRDSGSLKSQAGIDLEIVTPDAPMHVTLATRLWNAATALLEASAVKVAIRSEP